VNNVQFIKLVIAWGDTRNSDLLELIDSLFQDIWIENKKLKNQIKEFNDIETNIFKLAKDICSKNGEIIDKEFVSKLVNLYAQRPVNAEPVGMYCNKTNAMYLYESAGAASKLTKEQQPSITRAAQVNGKLNGMTWFKIFKGDTNENKN
jgi:hypothetical protein